MEITINNNTIASVNNVEEAIDVILKDAREYLIKLATEEIEADNSSTICIDERLYFID